jgi:hypothetical protein
MLTDRTFANFISVWLAITGSMQITAGMRAYRFKLHTKKILLGSPDPSSAGSNLQTALSSPWLIYHFQYPLARNGSWKWFLSASPGVHDKFLALSFWTAYRKIRSVCYNSFGFMGKYVVFSIDSSGLLTTRESSHSSSPVKRPA